MNMENNLAKFVKENDTFKVVFERVFNHSVNRVWDAITKPEELKYWFTDIEYEAVSGGKITIQFRDKGKTRSYGEVVSIEPPHRFVWMWEGELAVWELRALSEHATRLIFTYSKLAGEYAVNVAAGFHFILDLLQRRLEGSEATYPFGADPNDPDVLPYKVNYTMEMFRDYPEYVKAQPVIVEKVIHAPVDKIWKAITDKAQMEQWYFSVDDFRPEKGFAFRFNGQGTEGQHYVHLCRVIDVIPYKKLQYTWQYEGYTGYSIVTYELSEAENATNVTLSHFGLETFPQDLRDFAKENFMAGWTEIIGKLLPGFLLKQAGP